MSLRDVRTINICCLHYVGKSKTFIHNAINAKNWLVVYQLPTSTKNA